MYTIVTKHLSLLLTTLVDVTVSELATVQAQIKSIATSIFCDESLNHCCLFGD